MKRHEVQVLKQAGFTINHIAEVAEVSTRTAKRIVQEPAVAVAPLAVLAALALELAVLRPLLDRRPAPR